jgi:hypothetical protein
MPEINTPSGKVSPPPDTNTPFKVTLAVTATASDVVLVPALKRGRSVALVNEGPGDIAVAFDATATVASLLLREGDSYNDAGLALTTKISFINVTPAMLPVVRGILWSGNP